MDINIIALVTGGILLVGGGAFAVFLGISSSRIEERRHQETSGH